MHDYAPRVHILVLAACMFGACSLDDGASQDVLAGGGVPPHILASFSVEVMPVLLRDCGFHACHGSSERFFRVWGPGRTRYDDTKTTCRKSFAPPCYYDELDGYDRDASLQFARSFIDLDNPADSLLLRKPLALERGGAPHDGVDRWGRNVYRTPHDEGFLVLSRWVFAYAEAQHAYEAQRSGQRVPAP